MPELDEFGEGEDSRFDVGDGFAFANMDGIGFGYGYGSGHGDGKGGDLGDGHSFLTEWEGVLCQN